MSDDPIIQADQHAVGARRKKGRFRGGLSLKIHAASDGLEPYLIPVFIH
ncbi:MAG: hypothetical protein JKY17_01975 [Magnetovibrio sp.]|nr:hypothetical protein [Magnetovibrio sp.]